MYQQQVADLLHIDRTTYQDYELPEREYCPLELLEQLSSIYHTPVTSLMDNYHLFLYHNPGQALKSLRKSHGYTQRQFAERLHVCVKSIRDWEKGYTRISKPVYQKLFVEKLLE